MNEGLLQGVNQPCLPFGQLWLRKERVFSLKWSKHGFQFIGLVLAELLLKLSLFLGGGEVMALEKSSLPQLPFSALEKSQVG